MQTALISSYTPPSDTPFVAASQCDLLSLPLPSATSVTDPAKLSIFATYFLHSLDILLHMHPPLELSSFSHTLHDKPTLLAWAPHLRFFPDLHEHLDAILTRSYTLLTKYVKTQQSPRDIYAIRIYALRLLLHTSQGTIDPSTLWDQAVRSTTAYIRSADVSEDQATQAVMRVFDELADSNCEGHWRQGQSWVLFCEQWVMFAKRVCPCHLSCVFDKPCNAGRGYCSAGSH
jgi:separase